METPMFVVFFSEVEEYRAPAKDIVRYLQGKESEGYNLKLFEIYEHDSALKTYDEYVDEGTFIEDIDDLIFEAA